MSVRGKIIGEAKNARAVAGALKRVRPNSAGRLGGLAYGRGGRRVSSMRTARNVARSGPIVGNGTRSSRYLAGGLGVAYGGGALMNRRGPAADRVNGIRNTGMYQY